MNAATHPTVDWPAEWGDMDIPSTLSVCLLEQQLSRVFDECIWSMLTPAQRLWLGAARKAEAQLAAEWRWRPSHPPIPAIY